MKISTDGAAGRLGGVWDEVGFSEPLRLWGGALSFDQRLRGMEVVALRMMGKMINDVGESSSMEISDILATRAEMLGWLEGVFGQGAEAACLEEEFVRCLCSTPLLLVKRGMVAGVEVFAFTELACLEFYAGCGLAREFRRVAAAASAGDALPGLMMGELLAMRARLPFWEGALQVLAQRVSANEADVLKLMGWLFPPLGEEKMPYQLKRLMAKLSVDPLVNLTAESRRGFWRVLCEDLLASESLGYGVALGVLLRATPFQQEVYTLLMNLAEEMEATVLNLRACEDLTDLSGLERLTHLRSLCLERCHSVRDVSALRGLVNLELLLMNECNAVEDLEPLSGLTNLQELRLNGCEKVGDLRSLSGLTELRELYLDDCAKICDLSPLGGLTLLETLSLDYCTGLRSLDGIQGLTGLQKLSFFNSGVCCVEAMRGLIHMKHLSFSDCVTLTNLDALSEMRELESLCVINCVELRDLCALRGLEHLRELKLHKCAGLSDVSALGSVNALRELELDFCPGLVSLGGLQGLTELETLSVYGCTALTDLEPLREVRGLESLTVGKCPGVSDLTPLLALEHLTSLHVEDFSAASMAVLHPLIGLDTLYMERIAGLRDLDFMQGMHGLRWLWVESCFDLSDIGAVQGLTSLEGLRFFGCRGLSDVSALEGLREIKRLSLNDSAVVSLEPLRGMESLVELSLTQCAEVRDLSPLLGLRELKMLYLGGCTGLVGAEAQIAALREAILGLCIKLV